MAILLVFLLSVICIAKEPVDLPAPSPHDEVQLEEINTSPNPTPDTYDSDDFQGTLEKNGSSKKPKDQPRQNVEPSETKQKVN